MHGMSRLPQACCHTSHNTIISPFVTTNPNFRRLIRDILQNPLLVKTPHLLFYSNPSRVIIDFDPVSPNSRAFFSHPNNANSWGPFCRQAMLSRKTFGSGDSNQVNMNRRHSTIANLQQCDKWDWIARRIMSSLYSCIFFQR